MTFTLSLLANSASAVDWSRPLMIGWLVIALGLSVLEIWLAGGFSSQRLSPITKLTSNYWKRIKGEESERGKTMIKIPKPQFSFLLAIVMAVSVVLFASFRAPAGAFKINNTQSTQERVAGTDAAIEPTFKDYKGVRVGLSAVEVAAKLGEPAVKDENEEVFLISDFEMVQVLYDKTGGVSAISVTYSAEHPNPPTALAVLGEDVAADADGRIYKLTRYPDLGYWMAYSRTAGEAPVVSVTMNKM